MRSGWSRLCGALAATAVLLAMPSMASSPAAAVQWDGEGPPAPEVIAAIQARLSELGYYRGRADGIVGQMTREAIRRYERQVGVEPTGTPSLAIYRRLRDVPVEEAEATEPAEAAHA